jgi:hypothetical protein
MSESSFPFESSAEAAPPEDTETSPSRKPALLAGGLVASLLLGAGAFLLVGGGGDDEADDLFVPPQSPPVAAPAEAEPAPIEVVPAATTEVIGRNPFKARYVEPKASPAGAGTTAEGAAAGTASGVTSGTDAPTTTSGGGTGPSGATSGGAAPVDPVPEQPKTPPKYLSLAVVDPVGNQVTFKLVDREAATPEESEQNVVVKPGEIFASYFKLLGYGTMLDANDKPRNCTDLQYGDSLIKLCENESYQTS